MVSIMLPLLLLFWYEDLSVVFARTSESHVVSPEFINELRRCVTQLNLGVKTRDCAVRVLLIFNGRTTV
eukprot:SAG11_NODE_1174_length_5601_cov_51.300981_4_plen_69_part_00